MQVSFTDSLPKTAVSKAAVMLCDYYRDSVLLRFRNEVPKRLQYHHMIIELHGHVFVLLLLLKFRALSFVSSYKRIILTF